MMRGACISISARLLSLAVLVWPAVVHSAVNTCVSSPGVEGLCETATNPCTVSSTKDIDPGAVLDCSGLDITVQGGTTKIRVDGGVFTLKAKSLTLNNGRKIIATESASHEVGVRLEIEDDVTILGQIEARNNGGDSYVEIVAGGDVTIDGNGPSIVTEGTANSCDGGSIDIEAGGFVKVLDFIDASGKSGGNSSNMNSGGQVSLKAGTDVVVEAEIRSFGRWFAGGEIILEAANDVRITHIAGGGTVKGKLVADGRSNEGDGGEVIIEAGNKATIAGSINVAGGTNSNGGSATGGTLDVTAGCGGIEVSDIVDATGGWSGGEVSLQTPGDVLVSALVTVRAKKDDGGGGDIDLRGGDTVTLTEDAWLLADGHHESVHEGNGGEIALAGCQVDVQGVGSTGAIVEATGHEGGHIRIAGLKDSVNPASESSIHISSAALVDSGMLNLTACEADGKIVLDVRSPGPGECASDPSTSCTDVADCPQGDACLIDTGNPDTDGVETQFRPAPTKRLRTGLSGCDTTCS